MAKVFLAGHREVGASNSECEEDNLRAWQKGSRGSIPDDRQLYEPKMRTHI